MQEPATSRGLIATCARRRETNCCGAARIRSCRSGTEIYQPVCGTNAAGMRVTCFARAAKATNVTLGECAK
jgi:hypothetical protein